MATLTVRFFGPARTATGCRSLDCDAVDVADVLEQCQRRFGPQFVEVCRISKIWLNGLPACPADIVGAGDEVAVIPPVESA